VFDIIGKRNWYFLASGLVILPGLISLLIFHLRPGIDFVGGTLLQVSTEKAPATGPIQAILVAQGFTDSVVQLTGDAQNTITMRTKPMDNAQKNTVEQELAKEFGKVTELDYSTVGPVIGAELERQAVILVVVASLLILGYIAWAFRNVTHPFRYGVCAVAALLHDVLVVTGIFSILGVLFNIEVDALFVTAMLTVIGFSVHDTIVVFDRIRENMGRRTGEPFESVVNASIVQTLARSLNTSITVILTLLALFLFGGVTTRSFVLALLIGIFSGTYSSIFNASCLLVVWDNWSRRGRARAPRLAGVTG
jgi:preprotein translocase subunit SecF